ncbi:MAG: hypothetical protein ACYTEZ_03425 [Planctomycetota bacterium]|jgi:hypothetical protein
MWRIVLVALLAAACQNTRKGDVPEGYAEIDKHVEYDQFRPVTIAVLPVKAPTLELRREVRKEVYRLLPAKKYSPFMLATVDSHMTKEGKFDPGSLDWDATLTVDIAKWKPVRGTSYWAADGKATLRHKTGEVLWSCKFFKHTFKVPVRAGGQQDHTPAAHEIARFLVGSEPGKERFPDCPALSRE